MWAYVKQRHANEAAKARGRMASREDDKKGDRAMGIMSAAQQRGQSCVGKVSLASVTRYDRRP
jgi:hypothetical protein